MLILFMLFTFSSSHVTWPVENCTNDVNYMVPFHNNTILDPCDDGECWTYCDHEAWHKMDINDTEFSKNHLENEQKLCIDQGCADFHYAHIKEVQLLERCAIDKCYVEEWEVERVRNCTTLLIRASELYKDASILKTEFDQKYNINRSLVEYKKHRFIHDINTILTTEHEMIWDLELANTEMVKILEVKEPDHEIQMIGDMKEALRLNVLTSENITRMIDEAVLSTSEMDIKLWFIFGQIKMSKTLTGAMKAIKEYIDDIRDRVTYQYVFGPDVCPDIAWLIGDIERQCILCDHGDCRFDGKNFSCECELGWKGMWCGEEKNKCSDEPCINLAGCVDEYNTYRCECPTEWTGTFCQNLINKTLGCEPTGEEHPCQNNGNCFPLDNNYFCECPLAFQGTNCQYSLTDCIDQNPCEHGDCVFEKNRISCDCEKEPIYKQPFWTGPACSIPNQECNISHEAFATQVLTHGLPCSGHGVCTLDQKNASWECYCESDYIGDRCAISIDETNLCLIYSTACIHGSCQHCTDRDSCTCECEPGWEGEQCSFEINECEPNPCNNGAKCVDYVNEFYCDCSSIDGQFGGTLCAEKVTCAQKPCGEHFVSCNDESSDLSGISCMCQPGYMGDRCEIDARICTDNVCLNGGNCLLGHSHAFCSCEPGWYGDRCQFAPPYCNEQPCGSYGNCTVTGDGYKCICEPGWEGKQCNYNTDDCDPNPCLHGACVDLVNNFQCLCSEGWHGTHCDILKTPCDKVSCPRDGICIDTRLENWTKNDYTCLCAAQTCQVRTLTSLRQETIAIRTKSHSYVLWGFIIGAGLILVVVLFVYCIYYHEEKKREKRTNFKHLKKIATLKKILI